MARRKPLSRGPKEPEEILSAAQQVLDYVKPYLKGLIMGGAVLVLAVLGWSGYAFFQHSREVRAQASLEQARQQFSQPDQAEAALKTLDTLIQDYPSTRAALMARVFNIAQQVVESPNFDVFEGRGRCLLLGKCSRLPDDEEPEAGRYGIDFHRALPPFQEASGFTCDWGQGPIPVNAYTYACYLPKTLRFREFTANLAFAARNEEEYRAKRRVYEDFYRYLYESRCATVVATPHSGEVRRPPDRYHPFPQSETDAWTTRVAAQGLNGAPGEGPRLLISLHSTDYFGAFVGPGRLRPAPKPDAAGSHGQTQPALFPGPGRAPAGLPGLSGALYPGPAQWMEKRWGTLTPRP
jgi:hypothetical protein